MREKMRHRVLILGVTGMLGHKLWQMCRSHFDTFGTIRTPFTSIAFYKDLYEQNKIFAGIDLVEVSSLEALIANLRPSVILNAVGIVKQLKESKDPILSIKINALLPHELARIGAKYGCRIIHFSTDCVFDGKKGNYTEDDIPNATDLYGRTKALGEITGEHVLTIRSSIIGREVKRTTGLLEWFLSQRGKKSVFGYRKAIFSGLTTIQMAKVVIDIILNHPDLNGLYHISSQKISKYDLLKLIKDAFEIDIEIEPYDDFVCNRSLNGIRFVLATGFKCPSWPEMIAELAEDTTPYEEWRKIV